MFKNALATLLLGGAVGLHVSAVQSTGPSRTMLPSQVKLTEVEIRLAYETHGGCLGRCMAYNISVRGDGMVRYEDVGGEPRDAERTRTIPIEEVVDLVNDVLNARFFDAAANYSSQAFAVRDGDSLRFMERGSVDGPEWKLTVKIGAEVKTVRLYQGYPAELGRLRDRVVRFGRPQAGAAR